MPQNIFLDTNILLDHIIPYRRQEFPCSENLLRNLTTLSCNAWTTDYALAETLGEMKAALEKKLQQNLSQILSPQQIKKLENIINQVRHFPRLNIFRSPYITQKDIYYTVRNVCVQAKDALVLLSAQKLGTKVPGVKLVTRDERLLVRGRKVIDTVHPSDVLGKCPLTCSKKGCVHRK